MSTPQTYSGAASYARVLGHRLPTFGEYLRDSWSRGKKPIVTDQRPFVPIINIEEAADGDGNKDYTQIGPGDRWDASSDAASYTYRTMGFSSTYPAWAERTDDPTTNRQYEEWWYDSNNKKFWNDKREYICHYTPPEEKLLKKLSRCQVLACADVTADDLADIPTHIASVHSGSAQATIQ